MSTSPRALDAPYSNSAAACRTWRSAPVAWLAERLRGPRILFSGDDSAILTALSATVPDADVLPPSPAPRTALESGSSVARPVTGELAARRATGGYDTLVVATRTPQAVASAAALASAVSGLNPGGRLLLCVPHGRSLNGSAAGTYVGPLVAGMRMHVSVEDVAAIEHVLLAQARRPSEGGVAVLPEAACLLEWEQGAAAVLDEQLRRLAAAHREQQAGREGAQKQHAAERQRRRQSEARVERLRSQVEMYRAELALRKEEVRYQLGDALVRACRPSLDTLKLPGRLARLLLRGLQRVRARRDEAAERRLTHTPGQTAPVAASSGDGSDTPSCETAPALAEPYSDTPPALRRRHDLRLTAVTDEFSWRAWQYEADVATFTPRDWRAALEARPPELLLVESAWSGIGDSWYFQIRDLGQRGEVIKYYALPDVVEWCRARHIPTLFYNKEDPPNFDVFIDAARLFDYVCTSDANCLPDYRKHLGHDRVFALPFAAQPRIHNPVTSGERTGRVCFAGTWYAHRHFARQDDALKILRPGLDFGLQIYDRMANSGSPNYRWPDAFVPAVRGALPYHQMLAAYKRYKVFLNINSVTNSPTMFSRRVFELLACGTPVISSYSEGIEQLLGGDLVLMSEDEATTRRQLERVLGDDDYRARLALRGQRKVFGEHTYTHRLQAVLDAVGLERPRVGRPTLTAVAVVDTEAEVRGAWENFQRQAHEDKRLLLCTRGREAAERAAGCARQSAAVRVVAATVDSWASALRDVLAAEAGDWLAAWHPSDYYAPHYLTDYAHVTLYVDGPAFGKASWYALQGADRPTLRAGGQEYQRVRGVHPWTACVQRSAVAARFDLLAAVATPEAWWEQILSVQTGVYSADRFNYAGGAAGAEVGLGARVIDVVQV